MVSLIEVDSNNIKVNKIIDLIINQITKCNTEQDKNNLILNYLIDFNERIINGKTNKNTIENITSGILNNFSEIINMNVVNYFYWHTKISVGIMSQITDNKYRRKIHNIVNHELEIPCQNCGNLYLEHFNSRTEYQRRLQNSLKYICNDCKIKIENLNKEIKSERDLIKEKQKIEQDNAIQKLKDIPYKEYLLTEHWKTIRKRKLRKANYKCELCNSTEKLNVHHKTYENRGCEKDEDLIVLCEDCHGKFHDKLENPKEIDIKDGNNKNIRTKHFIFNPQNGDDNLDNQINIFLDNTYYKDIIDIKMTYGSNDTYSALMLYSI